MLHVLLVAARPYKNHSVRPRVHFPTQLLTSATVLRRNGHTVTLLDRWLTEGNPDDEVTRILRAGRVDLVVIEFTTKESPDAVMIADAVKRLGDVPVVAIGLHAMMYPRQTAEDPAFDVAVPVDPEHVLAGIADRIARGAPVPPVCRGFPMGSLGHGSNGRHALDEVYPPDLGLIDPDEYAVRDIGFLTGDYRPQRIVKTAISRGCPYSCSFCTDPYKGYSRLSNTAAVAYLDALVAAFRPQTVFFEDPEFFLKKRETLELLSVFEDRYDFKVISTSRADDYRPDYLNRDLIRRHRDRWLMWDVGAESGSEARVASVHKMVNLDNIRALADLCGDVGVTAGFSFMVGMPGETASEMIETVRFIEDLKRRARGRIFITFQYYQPLGPTGMAGEAESLGWVRPRRLRDWSAVLDPYTGGPSIYLNPWIEAVDLVHYLMLVVRYVINAVEPAGQRDLAEIIRDSWRRRSASGDFREIPEIDAARERGQAYFPTEEQWRDWQAAPDPVPFVR